MKGLFWTITLLIPIAVTAIGIELVGYWSIPTPPVVVEGDPIIAFDPEIGFVPFAEGKSKRSHVGDNPLTYHIYTDRRGARVSKPGEQTPDRIRALFIGDSFTWGHGVEAEDTFGYGVAKHLNIPAANFALGSYGTTHSLQMLRRYKDLAPRIIVYSFTEPQLQRNLSPCAASYYPFCLDQSHIAWSNSEMAIAPPFSNGVRRAQLHAVAQQHGLWPPTWFIHGLDVALGRVLRQRADSAVGDEQKQRAALDFLLNEMSAVTKSMNAELLIVYIPLAQMNPPPAALLESVARLNIRFLDMLPAFQRHHATPLYIRADLHPNIAGHALIASEIASVISGCCTVFQPANKLQR